MPQYHYMGRDTQGKLIEGKRESQTAEGLAAQLLAENIIPIEVTLLASTQKSWKDQLLPFLKSVVKRDELLIFSQQMQTLIQSGIPIIAALSRVAEILPQGAFKRVLLSLVEEVSAGAPVSVAMQKYPQAFPPVMLNLLKVGEESGNLDQAFGQVADYFELEEQTTKRIKTAFRYPMTVLLLISVAFVIINIFVIPRFAELFQSFKVELPLPTRVILGTSAFFRHYWDILLLALVFTVIFLTQYLRTKAGRYQWDKVQLKIPYIGNILNQIGLAQFATTFAIVIEAGIPLLDGLKLVTSATKNNYVKDRLSQLRDFVEQGDSITRAAIKTKFFSPVVIQMLAVGEETGAMDKMLRHAADYYMRTSDFELKRLVDKIEPLLLIIIGGMVLVLAAGVFLPMWNMVKLIQT